MKREKLYAIIEWGIMANGEILESQVNVTEDKYKAIKHAKKYKTKTLGVYVEEYWSDDPNNTKVVWGNKESLS